MRIWKIIRVVIIILSFIEGLLTPFFVKESPLAGVPFIFQALFIVLPVIIFPIAMVSTMFIQSVNPFQNKQWTLPDWKSNFLSLKNPLHFFHAVAYFIFSTGIGIVIASVFTDFSYLAEGLGRISGWAGIMIGIRLCRRCYHKKYQPISELSAQKETFKIGQYSKVIGATLFSFAFLALIPAVLFLKSSLDFKRIAFETEGVVIDNEEKDSSDGTYYCPVFSFVDKSGQNHIIHSTAGSNPPWYQVQEKVLILYNPVNPEEAKIASLFGLYTIPVVLGTAALVNCLAGVIFYFVVPIIKINRKS